MANSWDHVTPPGTSLLLARPSRRIGGVGPGFVAGIATPGDGTPNRNANQRIHEIAQVNWRRGLFRVWLLLSAAWIMGWTVYLILNGIKDGVRRSGDLLAIPFLLVGPPIALLLFGVVAGWALSGFVPD